MMIKFLVTFAIGIALAIDAQRYDARPVEWTGGNFDWPCETTKNMFKSGGRYTSKNVIATRAVIYKDEAIVALPRFKSGVPATLAKIQLRSKPGIQPLLEPYPCWSFQEEGNCAALQSAVDVFLDPQGILWVLDIGIVNSLEEPIGKCPPKVVGINLKTGKIVKTIILSSLTTPASRLQYVIADYSEDGRAFVYVTDAAARAILVYDVTSGRGYRVILPKVVTNGCGKRDVLYSVLLRRSDGTSCLVFTYLGSDRMFSLRTSNLRNGSTSGKIHDLGPKPKKMVLLGTDNGAAIFFRYESEPDIYRWDTNRSFGPSNFQKISPGNEFYLATQVMSDYKRGRMRLLQSNFPDFIQGTVGCGTEHAIVPI